MHAIINGLELELRFDEFTGYSPASGKSAGYSFVNANTRGSRKTNFPTLRVLKRLAKLYLDSPLEEFVRMEHVLMVQIKGGTSKERRAAFLGAVTARSYAE